MTVDQYHMRRRLIKLTHADPSHIERVLEETQYDEVAAEKQIKQELLDFAKGKIKFDANKKIIKDEH